MTNGPDPRHVPEQVASWGRFRLASGISPGTLVAQSHYLVRLNDAHDLDTVTADQVVAWLAGHTRWKASTRKSAVSAIRLYFRWAQRSGRRSDNPAELLGQVRVPPPAPRPVPEDALAAALDAGCDETRLMVLLAAFAGLRRAEIAGARREDLEGDLLRVTGKGGRTRIIPVGGVLLVELQQRPAGWLFPGRFGDGPVTPDYVGRRLSALLPPGYTGHKLRHRYATRVHNRSHDLLSLQLLLGHASPATTRAYVLSDLDQLRATAAAAL